MNWTLGKNGDDCAKNHAICDGATVIAKVYGYGYPAGSGWSKESEATARLISAAPELLELAQAMLGFDIATPKDYATKGAEAFSPMARHMITLQNQARIAITKATGEV